MTREDYVEATRNPSMFVYLEDFNKLWEDYQKLKEGIEYHRSTNHFRATMQGIPYHDAELYKLIEE